MVDRKLRLKITGLLTPHLTTEGERRALCDNAFGGTGLLAQIDYGGNPRVFASRLVSESLRYGEIEAGVPAVLALLDESGNLVGENYQREIAAVIAEVEAALIEHPEATGHTEGDPNKTIFISYRRENSSFIGRTVFSDLYANGYDVFFDVENLDSGDFERVILNQIAARTHFVVILAPGSLERCTDPNDWLRREIEYAMDTGRNIVPLLFNGFDFNAAAPLLARCGSKLAQLPRYNGWSVPGHMVDQSLEIVRSRFLKPPKQAVELQPTPAEEAALVEAKQKRAAAEPEPTDAELAAEFTPPTPSPTPIQTTAAPKNPSPVDLMLRADDALEVGNFDEAERLLREAGGLVRPNSRRGRRIADMLTEIADEREHRERAARAEALRIEAEGRYREIAALVNRERTRELGCEELEEFTGRYPDYGDPDNLARMCVGTTQALSITDILLTPFEWCEVPAGEFLFGGDEKYDGKKQKLHLPTFAIAKHPITYDQFGVFVDDPEGFRDPRWWEGLAKDMSGEVGDQRFKVGDHPREHVSWYDALAFCRWLSWRLGGGYALDDVGAWAVRLPTKFEWEKAARGTDGREYPWGNGFDQSKCNTKESGIGKTTPVTRYPSGASPYGALDMAGNVWEWCLTDYNNPAESADAENLTTDARRVLHGGGWDYSNEFARAAVRGLEGNPYNHSRSFGFRCVRPAG